MDLYELNKICQLKQSFKFSIIYLSIIHKAATRTLVTLCIVSLLVAVYLKNNDHKFNLIHLQRPSDRVTLFIVSYEFRSSVSKASLSMQWV